MVNGNDFPALLDSGATYSTINESMLTKTGVEICDSILEQLQGPSGEIISTLGVAKIPVLKISTRTGDIIVLNAMVRVISEEMNEWIIGQDLLLKLNIDVNSMLEDKAPFVVNFETGEITSQYPYLGGEDEEQIKSILEQALVDSEQRGLKDVERWRQLLHHHVNEFRLTLSHDAAARVPPMKVHLNKEKAKKVRPVRINYSNEQIAFMEYYTKRLIKNGYVRENPNARYASECLVIPKVKNPVNMEEDWRLVVNLKRANDACEPIYWPLPTFEDIQQNLSGAKYFISLDCKNGFWQIPLHPESQEIFSFATHRTVLTPCRMPQGASDSSMYFTYIMTIIFGEKLYRGLAPCIDDLLLYSDTLEGLFALLKWVLKKAREYGLKFSPKKLKLLAQSLKWVGKIITPEGVLVDPERTKALREMPIPTRANELMKFLNASNWIRGHFMEYAATMEPLQTRLTNVLSGKRSKRSARNKILEITPEYCREFEQAKQMLEKHTIRCHPKKNWDFVLMTDASDQAWGAVLLQIEKYDPKLDVGNQNPEPLAFLSGVFKKAQLNWSTPEKEAFALVESVEKLRHYLVRSQGFIILTDHRNLIFSYKPDSTKRVHVQAKIDRWGLKLNGYRYRIEHVAGVSNLWSDLLSRWGAPSSVEKLCRLTRYHRHVAQPIVAPVHELSFPTIDELKQLQEAASPTEADVVLEDGLYKRRGRVWIPPDARVLILTIAHYGVAGHYGVEATMQKLREVVNWKHMLEDVKQFIMDCVLCRCAKGVTPTRTHLGIQHRPTKPNQMLHFDFYSVGPSSMGFEYLLVLRDGFSRFVLLVPCKTTDAEAAVNGILDWIALFGIPKAFFSDQGPHFRNKVMKCLVKSLNVIHDFSTPYCAWANCLVERVLRDLKALFGLLCIETRTDREEWPKLIRNVQMAINHRPSKSLDGEAPVRVHTGMDAYNAVDVYVKKDELVPITWTVKMVEYLGKLQKTLDLVHQRVYEATAKVTIQARTKALGLFQFEIGDYVLYCSVDRQSHLGKLYFQWTGPYQIIDMKSPYVFHIQDLVQKKIIVAHVDRLSFFSTKQMKVTGELKDLISREGLVYDIEEFLDIIWDPDLRTYVVET
ncbi:MAG: hypothetical protein RLZZ262_1552, partial [Bacteroidota bacterium]